MFAIKYVHFARRAVGERICYRCFTGPLAVGTLLCSSRVSMVAFEGNISFRNRKHCLQKALLEHGARCLPACILAWGWGQGNGAIGRTPVRERSQAEQPNQHLGSPEPRAAERSGSLRSGSASRKDRPRPQSSVVPSHPVRVRCFVVFLRFLGFSGWVSISLNRVLSGCVFSPNSCKLWGLSADRLRGGPGRP